MKRMIKGTVRKKRKQEKRDSKREREKERKAIRKTKESDKKGDIIERKRTNVNVGHRQFLDIFPPILLRCFYHPEDFCHL